MSEIEAKRKELEDLKEEMRPYLLEEFKQGFVKFFKQQFKNVGHWEYAISLHLFDFEVRKSKFEGFNLGVEMARKEIIKVINNLVETSTFVTGNIYSNERYEIGFSLGFNRALEKLKQSLEGKQ